MFVLLFPDKSDVSSRHLLLMHQSTARRRTDVGGKIPSQTLRRSLYKPKCRIGLPPGSPEKLAWMFTSSPPPKKKKILMVAQSTVGTVWAIPLLAESTLTFRTRATCAQQGRKPQHQLPASLRGTKGLLGSVGPHMAAHADVPLLRGATCTHGRTAGIRKRAFPSANPSCTTGLFHDLGQVISPPLHFPCLQEHQQRHFSCPQAARVAAVPCLHCTSKGWSCRGLRSGLSHRCPTGEGLSVPVRGLG